MKLTSKQRHGLDNTQFALPAKRAYPIPDASHARNALARAAQNATAPEKSAIKAKVRSKFPDITVGGKPAKFANGGKVRSPHHPVRGPAKPKVTPVNPPSVAQPQQMQTDPGQPEDSGYEAYSKGGKVC